MSLSVTLISHLKIVSIAIVLAVGAVLAVVSLVPSVYWFDSLPNQYLDLNRLFTKGHGERRRCDRGQGITVALLLGSRV
jgi:hypothetical protein